MSTFARDIATARAPADLERIVKAAIGPSGFMEMAHFDLGEVLQKELGGQAPKRNTHPMRPRTHP